jgi:outer membrane protein OmpA-like peptidoglycan-associated protein
VIGHTDRSGNTKTNFALSQRRAENVYRLILAKGIKPESVKIEVVAKGDSDNAVINLKRKFEQRNRRVEVFVR